MRLKAMFLLAFLAIGGALLTPLIAQERRRIGGDTTPVSYFRDLFEKDVASFHDGLRACAVIAGIPHWDVPYAVLRQSLIDAGLIPAEWDFPPDAPLTKGKMAYMLCSGMPIQGGVSLRLFGTSERYAYRECVFLGLLSREHPDVFVTGAEILAILARTERYWKQTKIASAPIAGGRGEKSSLARSTARWEDRG